MEKYRIIKNDKLEYYNFDKIRTSHILSKIQDILNEEEILELKNKYDNDDIYTNMISLSRYDIPIERKISTKLYNFNINIDEIVKYMMRDKKNKLWKIINKTYNYFIDSETERAILFMDKNNNDRVVYFITTQALVKYCEKINRFDLALKLTI